MSLSVRRRNLVRQTLLLQVGHDSDDEPDPPRSSPRRRWGLCAAGLGLLLAGLWLLPRPLDAVPNASSGAQPPVPQAQPARLLSTAEFGRALPGLFPLSWPLPEVLHAPGLLLRTTLDLRVQREMDDYLQDRRPSYSAVAAVRPETGEIVCLSSYARNRDWRERNLALYAGFPAASVFKMVTAAGVLAEGKRGRLDALDYVGSRTAALGEWNLKTTVSRRAHWVTLEQAFAGSVNPVFGKLGLYDLGPAGLQTWAEAFGWGAPITDQLPVEPSLLGLTDDPLSAAEVGAGYTRATTLSPLHGAALAATIANGGLFIPPGVIHSAIDGSGRLSTCDRRWRAVAS